MQCKKQRNTKGCSRHGLRDIKMKYTTKKKIENDKELTVEIRLNDECHNGHDDFAITGDVYKISKNNRKVFIEGGCCHDTILKYYPEFQIFVDLHLSDNSGVPMYAVSNGYYHLQKNGVDVMKTYLRTNDEEAEILKTAENKEHFVYLIHKIGLLKKWENEADKAIKLLESLTGEKYDKKSGGHKNDSLVLSDSDYELFLKREREGYYSPENIEIRKKEREEKEREERIENLIRECNDKKSKIDKEYEIKIAIAELSPKTNFIFYEYKNELQFNWRTFQEEFNLKELNEFIPIIQNKFPNLTIKRQ